MRLGGDQARPGAARLDHGSLDGGRSRYSSPGSARIHVASAPPSGASARPVAWISSRSLGSSAWTISGAAHPRREAHRCDPDAGLHEREPGPSGIVHGHQREVPRDERQGSAQAPDTGPELASRSLPFRQTKSALALRVGG